MIEPAFTAAENFKWTPAESSVWIDGVRPHSVRLDAVAVSVITRNSILVISHLYLEHNVLRL